MVTKKERNKERILNRVF